MIEREISEFIRVVGSLSLSKSKKEQIIDCLLQSSENRKESSGKYVAVASAVAFLAVGTYLFAKNIKQDINVM
ncbi:MAG: hypothetical protein IKJ41_06180 [Clostridia bacterium]|nr:hypothetical protein [Clostridia bacterium]